MTRCARLGATLAALAAGAAYLVWARPRLLTYGATAAEARARLPGDDLVPGAASQSTMAVTLDCSPGELWPWLVQMGCDRAGWYSWDRLDNGGRPSAERIVPEWQHLDVGDRLTATPNGSSWFTAAVVEPPSTLVLRSDQGLPFGGAIPPDEEPPRWWMRSTLCLHLTERPDGTTRFVVRQRGASRPAAAMKLSALLVWEPVHLVMQLRQFHNLRRRVERAH